MKNKIIILSLLTILLSSCFNKLEEKNENLNDTGTIIIEDNLSKTDIQEITEKNNSGITNTGKIDETNSLNIISSGSNVDKDNKNEKKELIEIIDKSENSKVNTGNTDKSIDELLKDFDEDLNIEEILGGA